jgi:hypothetical protein
LWERDLWTGLCAECRKIAAAFPGLDGPSAALRGAYARADRRLREGQGPAAVERQLMANGLDPPAAATVVRNLVARRAPYALASELLDGGAPLLDVRQRLVEGGLAPEDAAAVVNAVQEARSGVGRDGDPSRCRSAVLPAALPGFAPGGTEQSPRPSEAAAAAVFMACGGLVFLLGVALFIGNTTRLFPTLPFAGFILMTVGGAIAGAARAARGG